VLQCHYNAPVKRPLRITFNLLSTLSLLLCIASIVLWVRSYIHGENLDWFGQGQESCLMSNRGRFGCYRAWSSMFRSQPTQLTYTRRPPFGLQGRSAVLSRQTGIWHIGPVLGFELFQNRPLPYVELHIEMMAPWWSLTLLTAALPLLRWRAWLKRPRDPGLCRKCGYDLRATPDRCPECGAVPRNAPHIPSPVS
jgi:hypothetical protein